MTTIPSGKYYSTGSTFGIRGKDVSFEANRDIGLSAGGTFSINVNDLNIDVTGGIGITGENIDITAGGMNLISSDTMDIRPAFFNMGGGTGMSIDVEGLVAVKSNKIILDTLDFELNGSTSIVLNSQSLVFNNCLWPTNVGNTGDILIQSGETGIVFTTIENEITNLKIDNKYNRRPVDSGITSVLPGDDIIAHIGVSGLTINLPGISSLAHGVTFKIYTIVDEGGNASNNNINIVPDLPDNVLGGSYFQLKQDFNSARFYHNGENGWFIM
jgi:hypothetical protein